MPTSFAKPWRSSSLVLDVVEPVVLGIGDVASWSDDFGGASREQPGEARQGRSHSEFRYGSFVRQVRLPAGTSPEVVSATYKDRVLEIRMPKPSAEAASRRIQIQRG